MDDILALWRNNEALRIGFALVANIPLAYMFKNIGTSWNICSIFISAFWCSLLYGPHSFLWVLGVSISSYYSMKYANSPFLITLLLMIYLAFNHYVVQILHSSNDFTAPLMVLVMKISSFSWNLHDGVQKSSLTAYQNNTKVIKIPNLISFLGYVFFFPAFLVGPSFSYVDYSDFVSKKRDFKHIESTIVPALRCSLWVIVSGVFMFSASSINHQDLLVTPKYLKMNVIMRCLFHN
jgi:lysophospholipid acyltransferase